MSLNNLYNDSRERVAQNVTTAEGLYEKGFINQNQINELQGIADIYPLSVTDYYLGLIQKNDYSDPIFKMCVPSSYELGESGRADTSGECENTIGEGIQHKYDNTVLLLSTNVCAMYCRHCFRKRLVGQSEDEVLSFIDTAVDYIRAHTEVDNVLITGGDALMMSNRAIEKYLKLLTEIPHIRYIRFGTRVPVVFPERIIRDGELIDMFQSYRRLKSIYIVTQFNHVREITPVSTQAVKLFRTAGVPVLNQTVLMRGVNSSADDLCSLFNELLCIGISPYYLFQCRPVKGVKDYFAVPLLEGAEIVDEARARLSGPAKRFRYAMSHVSGKIEILGATKDGCLLIKQHQAKHNPNCNRILKVCVDEKRTWLPDNFAFEEL